MTEKDQANLELILEFLKTAPQEAKDKVVSFCEGMVTMINIMREEKTA